MSNFDLQGTGILQGGVQGFIQGMRDSEDRKFKQMEFDAKQRADSLSKERQAKLDEIAAKDKEFDNRRQVAAMGKKVPTLAPGQSITQFNPSELPNDEDYLRAKAEADMTPVKKAIQNMQFEKAKGDADKAKDEARKRGLSPIPGYQKTDQYVGDETEERSLRTAYTDYDKFRTTMNNLKAKVQSASKEELANPYSDTRKAIANDLRDLQLTYKGEAFAKLGVLAGPDMGLLESIIENPGTLSNLVSGKEGVLKRYDQALSRVDHAFDARVKSLGLAKAPSKDTGGLIPKDRGLMKDGMMKKEGVQSKPKTIKQNGFTYTLNPQTGEYE